MAGKSIDVQYDMNAIPIVGLVPEQGTSAVGTSVEGRLLTRTDSHILQVALNGTAKTLVTTDDTQLQSTTPRPPNGAAGGDLTGSFPNPTIGANKVVLASLALALIESGVSSGTAATTDPALRKLGFGANDAMAGNARLDQIAAPTGATSFGGNQITNVTGPTLSTDAATKGYVDQVAQGLDAKPSVLYATTVSLGIATALPTVTPTTIDGVTVNATNFPVNTRLLVKNESSGQWNGIWVVTASATSSLTLARANDMDSGPTEFSGAFVFVESGAQGGSGWVCVTPNPITTNTTVITFAQFSSVGSYIDGAGLALTGLTFSVNVDGSSIEIISDILRVKAGGITNAMLAGSIDLTTKVTGVLPAANGGKSAIVASPALTAGTWTDVVHSLGVIAGRVMVKVHSTNEQSELGVRDKSGSELTTIQIKTDIAAGRASAFYDIYAGI